jgi:hypothetical protein
MTARHVVGRPGYDATTPQGLDRVACGVAVFRCVGAQRVAAQRVGAQRVGRPGGAALWKTSRFLRT